MINGILFVPVGLALWPRCFQRRIATVRLPSAAPTIDERSSIRASRLLMSRTRFIARRRRGPRRQARNAKGYPAVRDPLRCEARSCMCVRLSVIPPMLPMPTSDQPPDLAEAKRAEGDLLALTRLSDAACASRARASARLLRAHDGRSCDA